MPRKRVSAPGEAGVPSLQGWQPGGLGLRATGPVGQRAAGPAGCRLARAGCLLCVQPETAAWSWETTRGLEKRVEIGWERSGEGGRSLASQEVVNI